MNPEELIPRSEADRLVREAVERERERIVELIKREKWEYQKNADACYASGNTMGGTLDSAGACTCDLIIAAILNPPTEESGT